jgi:ELWxxDGT repeat protein
MEAWNAATQRSLYRTDGTVAGTFKLLDNYRIGDYIEYNGNLYFKNFKGNLVRTDGTVANTLPVTSLSISGSSLSSGTSEMAVANNFIFFASDNVTNGTELWKSDGTAAGTSMVKDINLGTAASNPQSFAVLNNNLYFLAFDGTNYGLWKSDGTNAGTVLIRTLSQKVNITYYFNLKNINNVLYFDYNDGINGHELWKSDGTNTGTVLLKDINPNGSSEPRNFADMNEKLYFTANDNIHGLELWVSDGTAAGTNMLYDVNPGVAGSFPQSITFFNNYIYFFAFSATKGYELWRFDPNTLETIATNTWPSNPTWNTNTPPTAIKSAKINSTHTVNIPNAGNQVKTIIMNGGNINLTGGTLEIKNQ